MSWTSAFVSLAVVEEERSWLSFARSKGWVERWMLEGKEDVMVVSLSILREVRSEK